MTITELVEAAYKLAVEKGWDKAEPVPIPEQIALIHSEVSEALESWRKREPLSWTGEDGKPEGIASEYADILIRVAHYAKALDINLEAEVQRKLAYNQTRPFRSGGKRA